MCAAASILADAAEVMAQVRGHDGDAREHRAHVTRDLCNSAQRVISDDDRRPAAQFRAIARFNRHTARPNVGAMLARVTTFAIDGLEPRRVTVEVDVAPGCRRSRSSASATARCARRASACARRSSTRASSSRAARHGQPRAGVPAQGRPGLRPRDRLRRSSPPAARCRPRRSSAGGVRRARPRRRGPARAAARSPSPRAPREPGWRGWSSRASGRRRPRSSTALDVVGAELLAQSPRSCAAASARRARRARRARPRAARAPARPRRRPRPRRRVEALTIAAAGGHNLLLAARRARARRCSRAGCRRSCRR